MDTLQAIAERRSIKHFDPNHTMTEEERNTLLSHAILTPSSFNIQNWRIVDVQNQSLRQQIREAAWDQAQVTDASMLLLICADLKSWKKHPERYWQDAPDPAREMIVPMIAPFYSGKPELQRDEAMRSTGLIAQTLMLSAKTLGYDSCPMIGFDPKQVSEIIKLPEDHTIGMMLTIGKATQPAWPRPGQLPLNEIVVTNNF
ncbi:Putative NAD(P)H nitroreductase MhqN [Poriferisphaera corsica]|uniref:NAD(P)H nitroreductase MhqN n=1 Tax=Poriferisphaera corsica TaxID=2528020 RepID=A0A517YYL1_9BACT|nr:nitroreductase family protein [Poriferisphaera corsica]QDU35314.1 Putative NAD(P)H nitroreductase MhqN [Poriferisphaera corsica]